MIITGWCEPPSPVAILCSENFRSKKKKSHLLAAKMNAHHDQHSHDKKQFLACKHQQKLVGG